jgi:hypothetical protein
VQCGRGPLRRIASHRIASLLRAERCMPHAAMSYAAWCKS